MKLLSWNVNGIRAIMKNGFYDFLHSENPDILCLQETKAHPEQINVQLDGYHQYWNAAERRGYSGTAIFTRVKPLAVHYGLGMSHHDKEGRLLTAEFADYYLVNVYTPNSKRGLLRLDYRTEQWDPDFLEYLKKLEEDKPVIVCGDLNVAHKEIDLANPRQNRRNAGFTDEERASMDRMIEAGFIDTFREFEKGAGHYSWWSYIGRAREKNVGWRIDYFLLSPELRPRLKNAFILPEVKGSDHCPVGIILI
jgi:exodeoxyribonuclease-3